MTVEIQPATLRLMSTLLNTGGSGASREQLIQQADIGTTTFYRVVRPLLADGLVQEHDGRYVLPLTIPYNYRFKQWHDMERLHRLPEVERSAILDILDQTRKNLGDDLICLWLLGSAAHDALTASSDLDFIAVCKKDTGFVPSTTRPLNFFAMTVSRFTRALDQHDPFVVAALRYGIVLHDQEFAQRFYARLPAIQAAPVEPREEVVANLVRRFHYHVENQELVEAAGALKSVALQTARSMLAPFGEMPGSKTELTAAARLYLGKGFAAALAAAAATTDTAAMFTQERRLARYLATFQAHATHLASFAQILSSAPSLEVDLPTFFHELFPELECVLESHSLGRGRRRGGNIFLGSRQGRKYVIAWKSSKGPLDLEDLQHLVAKGKKKPQKVLVVCECRDLPPLQRPPLTPALLEEGRRLHTHIIPASEIVSAHAMLHLDDQPVRKVQAFLGLH
jgi:hypothetical protein